MPPKWEWIPTGQNAPRRLPFYKLLMNHLKANWPTSYRDTSAFENPSEHILKPFNLKDEIAWGVSFKHFEASQALPENKGVAIAVYHDEKYNDWPEWKFAHGNSHKIRSLVCVDLTYRFTESVTTLDGDDFPLQYEGNKQMILNIFADCAAMKSQGVHYIYPGRIVFDGRYSDEEIFLERLSRDVDPKVFQIDNDVYWSYRRIFKVDVFEDVRLY
jgi:hypothetical protein